MRPRTDDLTTSQELTAPQRRFLVRFADSPFRRRFYLAGGAALSAGYFGHRESDDLDLFGPDPVPLKRVIRWMEGLPGLEALQWLLPRERTTFMVSWDDGSQVKVEYRQFPFPPWVTPHTLGPLYLASAEDLATDKLYAATERRYELDRVDLYFLMRDGGLPPLTEVIRHAEVRFGLGGELARPLEQRLLEPAPTEWPDALRLHPPAAGYRGFLDGAAAAAHGLW